MKLDRKTIFLLLCTIILFLFQACKDPEIPTGPIDEVSIDRLVDTLLSKMMLDEKIGQMTQVDREFLEKEEDIRDYFLGSLLSGGGSSPPSKMPSAWADMVDRYQSYALQTRLKIPLIYGIDAVHGHNNVWGAVIFPHNIGMGCTHNPVLIEEAARVTAEEVVGTGIHWTFSPCIAVPRDIRWGRTYEGFAETPDLTMEMAEAAVKGYQGPALGTANRILACAKHFLGDGGTTGGQDQGNTQVDEATLRAIHLPGYVAAVNAGVGSIMVSFSSWNGVKMHSNQYLLTDILKGGLGFKGFLISDWGAVDQLPGDYGTQIATAINAGLDMIMVPDNYKKFFSTLRTLVQTGRVPLSRIDDAVRRILRVKYELGLFERTKADRSFTAQVGSAAHRVVARECVRQSLVLLKNSNAILPLQKTVNRIHVAGSAANDIGMQCGGWTITWQGEAGSITPGTTIFQAVKNAVSQSTQVTYSADGSNAAVHKIVPRGAHRSYGIHVAQLAGLPKSIIVRAQEVLAELESHASKKSKVPRHKASLQIPLFSKGSLLADEIARLDIDSMSPLEAITKLYELKRIAQENKDSPPMEEFHPHLHPSPSRREDFIRDLCGRPYFMRLDSGYYEA